MLNDSNYKFNDEHWLGQNNQAGKSILKTDYSENSTIENNIKLAVKILLKTMDSTTPSADRFEISSISRDLDGDIVFKTIPETEVRSSVCQSLRSPDMSRF